MSKTSADVRRRLVPPLAAVTVLAVLLGGGYAFRHASNNSAGANGGPAILRLSDYQQPAAGTPGDSSLRLAGNLPGGPSDAAVRWVTSPQRSDVEQLAKALGIRGHLTRAAGVTTYTTQAGALRVQQDGAWQFSRTIAFDGIGRCPPYPTDGSRTKNATGTLICVTTAPGQVVPDQSTSGQPTSDQPGEYSGTDPVPGLATAPPVTSPPVTATSPPSPPSGGAVKNLAITTPQAARSAARPVLEAVGLDPAVATVQAGQAQGFVTANPTVNGLPTQGLATMVTVFGTQVAAAGGWLGGSREGATYPVISAAAAWKQLRHTPMVRPMMACPEPAPGDSDPMICGGPITVTGASFGRSLHEANGRQVLVPSWLFDVRGSDTPLSVVAIDPRYLAAPSGPTMGGGKPGTGSGSGGSTGSGSVGTAVPPVGPSTDPGTPESRFSAVTASGSGLVVHFTGGVSTCFSYTVTATETQRKVSLGLTEKVRTPTKPCPEMAQVYERRVPLAKPLGTRHVVDAKTGAVLL
jgi:hypothetical protein